MLYGDSICYFRTRTRAGQTSTAVVIKLMRSLCFAHALCKRNSAIKTVQVMNPAFKSNTACEAFWWVNIWSGILAHPWTNLPCNFKLIICVLRREQFAQRRHFFDCFVLAVACLEARLLVGALRQPTSSSDQYATPDSARDRLVDVCTYLLTDPWALLAAHTGKQKRQLLLHFKQYLPCVWIESFNLLQMIRRRGGVVRMAFGLCMLGTNDFCVQNVDRPLGLCSKLVRRKLGSYLDILLWLFRNWVPP